MQKTNIFAVFVIAMGIFAITYLKYMSDAKPQVDFQQAQQRLVIQTYESYLDWALDRPTVEVRTRRLPDAQFDSLQASPHETWNVRFDTSDMPYVEKPD